MVMAAIVVPGLLPFKLETSKCVALYSPQRVLRQMGYDQGAVSITKDSRSPSLRDMKARFIEKDQDMILEDHQRLLWPSTWRVGVRSLSGVLFCEKCI